MALTDLLEGGNELTIELGAQGESYGDYCKTLLVQPYRERSWQDDRIGLHTVGYMSRLFGNMAYVPAAAKVFDGPYQMHSRFQFDNGTARLTVRQVTGTWVAERLPEIGRYALRCKKPDAICLVPQSLRAQSFIFRMAFKAEVSIEGIYAVFFYEDEENYWIAGVKDDAGTQKLRITRVLNGSATVKSSTNLPSAISVGNWYTMYLEMRPGRARVYLEDSDSYDFSSYHVFTQYATSSETTGTPESYHVGLGVEHFGGWEGAETTGTVTDVDHDWLEDTGETFTSAVRGKWVRCNNQDRQIISHTANKIFIQPSWSEEPAIGADYGIYTSSTKDGPQCYFKELWLCEGIIPYTVDDVTDSILALSGVERSAVYPDTAVGTLSSGAVQMNDVDVVITSSSDLGSGPISLAFWCSTTATSGAAAYSGLVISVYTTTTLLQTVESDGVSGQTTTTAARHHNMVDLVANTTRTIRVQASKNGIVVSCDGHFLTAFPAYGYNTGGWVARETGDTAVTTEFPEILDSFIWDAAQPASAALSRLLQGRRAKLIERSDGSVAVSRFDTALGDAGTYSTPVTRLGVAQRVSELAGLIELVGAEDRVFLVDEDSARHRLSFVRADNPTVESQEAGLKEAHKLAVMGYQRFEPGVVALYAPDPGLELEDEFTTDSVDYVAEGITVDWQSRPSIQVAIRARQALPAAAEANWGSDPGNDCDYDDGTEYG